MLKLRGFEYFTSCTSKGLHQYLQLVMSLIGAIKMYLTADLPDKNQTANKKNTSMLLM